MSFSLSKRLVLLSKINHEGRRLALHCPVSCVGVSTLSTREAGTSPHVHHGRDCARRTSLLPEVEK